MPRPIISSSLKIILLLIFIYSKPAYCQKPDSVFYYTENNKLVSTIDSADFIRVVTLHPDADKLYALKEYYKNGQLRRIGKSSFRKYLLQDGEVSLEGQFISYYPDGKKQAIGTCKNNWLVGDINYYYPSGKLYCVKNFKGYSNFSDQVKLIACYDTLSRATCENGNGRWLEYYIDYKKIRSEGPVINGLAEGTWRGHVIDSIAITSVSRFELEYKKGVLIGLKSYDVNGIPRSFKTGHELAAYQGDLQTLISQIRERLMGNGSNNLDNTVVSLVVEKDGSLTDITIEDRQDNGTSENIAQIIRKGQTWKPGTYLGFNMRYRVHLPLSYQNGRDIYTVKLTQDLLSDNAQPISGHLKFSTTGLF
jgi:antitoxin component YwqK of YwqJK toxin-antitoxin module